jgi:hypothetical protein
MTIDDIAKLVSIIEGCKAHDVRKILFDYLVSELHKDGMIRTIKPLSIEDIKPVSSWRNKCAVCHLDSVQGYVCSRGDCPSKITSGIGINSVNRTSGIDTY